MRANLPAARALFILTAMTVAVQAHAQSTFKVAYFNIQSGKGEPPLPGRQSLFADNTNCTDASQPMNAWGVGFVQSHLKQALNSDPGVIALGISEAWGCARPSNVATTLGWKAASTERNGTALLARHGFAGPEEWVQLDTSLTDSPNDTKWVVRIPVCLDAACSVSVIVFAAHWHAYIDPKKSYEEWLKVVPPTYDKQGLQTVEFLERAGGAYPHILIGDLNTWDGQGKICGQYVPNAGLTRLRDAGYVDAWPLIHGSLEGYTGMTNRVGCGTPEGYAWKRIDYVWSPASYLPVSVKRFGIVTAGDPAPSDHYGLIAEFPWPGGQSPTPTPAPAGNDAGPGEIVLYASDATITGNSWLVTSDVGAAGGARAWNPDRAVAKLTSASATPVSYIELSFNAEAGKPYRLWMRGKAESNYWGNDSVFVQFDGSLNESGAADNRIGTTRATVVSVEDGSNAGLSGWGWQDNGYGVLGPLIWFADPGPQRMRIQQREDGISIDQIILSPSAFVSVPPGSAKNDATLYLRNGGTGGGTSSGAGDIILIASDSWAPAGGWKLTPDATAAGGSRLWHADSGAAKLSTALAHPVHYFELTFTAQAGVPYRLWVRGKADNNHWANDSVFVQFSNSVDSSGVAAWRIGTAESTVVNLEEGSGQGLAGWGWQDNGYGVGVLGPTIVFATAGTQTIRVQTREDGFSIDQIVLSPQRFLSSSPGALKNDTTKLR